MEGHPVKIILTFFVIGFLIFYPIQIAHSAAAVAYILKEFTLDVIARVLGRNVLSQMINAVVGFIGVNGRDGAPNFVQNWRNFLEEAQYRGEDSTRAIIGAATAASGGTVCQYLRNPLANAFGASKVTGFNPSDYRVDSLQFYAIRNLCTLPAGFDVNLFRNDFAAGGGWATWDKLIQPQNNFFGVYADSLDELGKQRNFEEKTDKSESEPSGFTSKRKTGQGQSEGCELEGPNGSCLILGNVLSPAQMFRETAAKLNLTDFEWISGVDELSEVVAAAVASWVTGRLGNLLAGDGENFTADTSRGQTVCVQAGEGPCYEKAKKLDCDASGTGGSGGSGGDTTGGGSGGSGGDANVDCTEVIDRAIYDACIAEVRASCGIR